MRVQAPYDELLLEPLPVVVPTPDAHAHAGAARVLPPWSGATRTVAPPTSARSFLPGFSRMIGLEPGRLRALPEWWQRRARDGRVEIARRLVLEEPRRGRGDTWRMRGWLRAPWRARAIPVELLLWPRLDAWTRLAVEPQRGVHVGRRYFSSGHRVLDELSARLVRELGSEAGSAVVAPRD